MEVVLKRKAPSNRAISAVESVAARTVGWLNRQNSALMCARKDLGQRNSCAHWFQKYWRNVRQAIQTAGLARQTNRIHDGWWKFDRRIKPFGHVKTAQTTRVDRRRRDRRLIRVRDTREWAGRPQTEEYESQRIWWLEFGVSNFEAELYVW